jgi:hypothetical protein
VFVHGYQASRQDFILFKSCLEIKYKCRVFISSSNEGRTEETIENLGKRLAVELNNFFKNIEFGPSTRLSFVGHSMGGIIIRSALSYIKNIDPYLYTYMSFSSPHLGYLYEPSALVQAGLWLLNTWQKSESLD